MLSTILAALTTPQGIGAGIVIVVLGYVLKHIDNKWVYKPIYGVCYAACTAVTLGLSKWKWTKGAWNKTIEPYIVDLLDNVLSAIKNGCFDGLHSDNPPT